MFSNTFNRLQVDIDCIWKFQHYSLVCYHLTRPCLPPPFIFITHIWRGTLYFFSHYVQSKWFKLRYIKYKNKEKFSIVIDIRLIRNIEAIEDALGNEVYYFVSKVDRKQSDHQMDFDEEKISSPQEIVLNKIKTLEYQQDDMFEYLECLMNGIRKIGGDDIEMPKRSRRDSELFCIHVGNRDSRERAGSLYHHFHGKRNSTTFDTTSESLPIKRPRLPPVSYPTLMKLLDKSPEEILTGMLDPNFQLNKFLNDKRMQERDDWVSSMTILLEKMTQCTESRERITMILEQLPNTLYLEGVYNKIRKLDPTTNQFNFKLIELFLKISNTLLAMIPHSADGFTKIFDRIELQFTKNKFESREFEDAKEILDQVLERVKDIEKVYTTNKITTMQNDIGQPPNDYRQLHIVPDLMELLSEQRQYLRKNIVDGVYENAEQYLDIHFRLLREDFIGPLRDGIQQHLFKVKSKNYNVRIYENVQSLGSRLTPRNGIVYDLRLDAKLASRIRWANSRRLIYGNLLLLTFDNFHSCVFVTVEDRSQLERNYTISVKTLEDFDNSKENQINLDKIAASCPLTMIETMTYFEAYRPVLNALQMIPSDHQFPLAPFLLKLSNVMIPPDYIKPTTTYDFTPLLVDPNLPINYKQTHQVEKKYRTVPVLEKDQWPTSEQLHLNPKQYEALILALTNKVALIQGPPGTGKTYLGVRITEMLLHNRSVWRRFDEQSTPILMICHTNHALDQFLELIVNRLNISHGIIRVGSRCQNSSIQQFSLKNARQRARENRSLPKDILHQKWDKLAEKVAIEEVLKSKQNEMEKSRNTILSLSFFTQYPIIDQTHLSSLLAAYDGDTGDIALLQWLGFYSDFERIPDHFIHRERDVLPMETNDTMKEMQEDEFNEEDEEEERRRHDDDIDLEEYAPTPGNLMDRRVSSTVEINSGRERQTVQNQENHYHRFIRYITESPTTLNDETVKRINGNIWQLHMEERYDLYRYWLLKYRQYLQNSLDNQSREYNQTVSTLTEYRQEEDYHLLKNSIIVAMTTTCAAKYHNVLEKLRSKIVIVEEAAATFEAHIITALSTKCEHLILIGDHVQLKPNPSVYRLAVKYQIDVSLFERLIKNKFPNVQLNIQHRMRPEIARLMKYFYDDLEDHVNVESERAPVRGIDSNLFFINHNHMEANVDDGRSYRNEFEAKYVIELAQYLIKQGYNPQQITVLTMYLGQRQFIAKLAKQRALLYGVRIMITDNYQGEENDIIILSLVRNNPEKNIGFLKTHNRICVALSRARCGLFVIGNMTLLAEVDDMWKQIVASVSKTNNLGNGLSLSCRQHWRNKFIADKPESFAQRPEGGCRQTCDARLPCGHRCERMCHNYDFEHKDVVCHKQCPERLSCGHPCKKRCHIETPNRHNQCSVFVDKKIPECGHKIRIECYRTPTTSDCKKSPLRRLDCGHDAEVPCRIISSPSQLKRFFCPELCGKMLACEHKCIGKCGNCRAGKLHMACGEKCERQLICSHACKAPCAMNCPPCSRLCETRCAHSRCIGICGELCPPQCRCCDKSRVQEILFGTEEEPDARFVFLPDCGHIIEVTSLDQWIKDFENNPNNKTAIRFPECPRCRQRIYQCTRYMSILNRVHESISQVKRKILGNKSQEEMDNRRTQLIAEYEKIKRNLQKINLVQSIKDLFSELYKENRFFSDDMFNLMTNILTFLNEIDAVLIDGRKKLKESMFEDLVNDPLRHIMKYLSEPRRNRNFAEQQLNDIQSEFKRIRRVIHIEGLVSTLKQTLKEDEKECIDSMQHLTKKSGPFTDEDRQKFDDLVRKFEQIHHLPGLGITDSERINIVRALNISKGHWFICPNGHPYVITECGGASQESQCPDCGEQIGGQNHHLLESNHHFGLMDGSQHAAWSNEANLN
ncbi:unnamed protein product [Rotaria sordida]|uniref:RZ-type domain-containing protein n=1 Tax=Rotaria sordida TaxID=392033 RepID=A0A814TXC2_9BILA|nr:unnamed protein product [Rotaria sordida]CAF1419093.1 unnamed protein product [Rotaria sordida]